MRLPSVRTSMMAAVLLCLAAWAIGFLADRILSADGSYYLARLADWQGFVLVGWHRSNAQYATQFLPVYGSRLFDLGLEEIKHLYALNVFLPAVVSFALCLAWMRNAPTLLAYPLISFVLLELNSTFIIMGEHHVLALCAWPLLAFCLFPERRWYDWVAFYSLCILSLRLYEAAVVVLAIPFCLCLWNGRTSSIRRKSVLWFAGAVLLAIGIGISLDGIVHPRDVSNYNGFREQTMVALGSPLAQACLAMVLAVLAAQVTGKRRYLVAGVIAVVAILFVAQMTWHRITGGQSFAARTFSVSVLPLLMAAAVLHVRLRIGHAFDRTAAACFAVFIGIACAYSAITEWRWHKLMVRLEQALDARSGRLSLPEIGIGYEEFASTFPLPTMSVIMSGPCVTRMLQLPDDYWVPYDPVRDRILTRYRDYAESVGGPGCPSS
ncbi:hypothetical protein [Rhizobium sp. SSA_523]|uniref:hypothetical protein n=1 Tax=Rhizobium sp. SSA_523 TaxID=2952477 RepID=UPI0020918294|nr:hypothetical protein [Rhizobium sp. SSA_523]MCO5730186.1 hypothetical protein [Rhizobium sp. SSA_523]WKC25248.1 hypothetical protein QTJ18_14790 [Rhizobium sp. SSA_523]